MGGAVRSSTGSGCCPLCGVDRVSSCLRRGATDKPGLRFIVVIIAGPGRRLLANHRSCPPWSTKPTVRRASVRGPSPRIIESLLSRSPGSLFVLGNPVQPIPNHLLYCPLSNPKIALTSLERWLVIQSVYEL